MTDATETETEKVLPCGLTPEQREKWDSTCSMMVWTCPGFAHLWYKLLNNQDGEYTAVMTKGVPFAATDAKNILINPDTFFKFSLPERTFVMAHEIVHNVYGDVELLHRCNSMGSVPMNDGTTPLPFRNSTMQRAMDLRINALLIKSKIGRPPKEGHFDDKMTGEESVLDVYKKCYEEEGPDPDQEGGDQPGNNPGGFDTLQPPGKSTGQNPQSASQQRNPQQWAVEIAAAQVIEAQKSQGKMAGALKRMFEKLLEPEVDWKNHIQTLINRITGSGGWNWKQPDEWWAPHEFFSPRRSGKGAGWIVVWGDTSGSRGDDEIASNMAELAGILEDVNPQRITVLWCDADIDYIDEVKDPADLATIQARGTAGGGGTSQTPVFDWIAKQDDKPDLYIGFTDGFVDFPDHAPPYPVIWASSTDQPYPFGQVVKVNRKPVQP
jgi:predicted metal-dependent peptidase